jgi:hypothetical protein
LKRVPIPICKRIVRPDIAFELVFPRFGYVKELYPLKLAKPFARIFVSLYRVRLFPNGFMNFLFIEPIAK